MRRLWFVALVCAMVGGPASGLEELCSGPLEREKTPAFPDVLCPEPRPGAVLLRYCSRRILIISATFSGLASGGMAWAGDAI
jgi:hypothetical protein